MTTRTVLAALWRHRAWWLTPLVIIAIVLALLLLAVPGSPLVRYIYGPV